MSNPATDKRPPAEVRPGVERRVTNDAYKAQLAEGFVAAANRMPIRSSYQQIAKGTSHV